MKVNTFTRLALGLGATALALGSVVAPANADPATGTFGTLVGLGSDTTQDVMNAVALAIGGGKIASYDATGSSTVVTRSGGAAVPRANGSGAGRDLLRVAIGQTESSTVATATGSISVTTSGLAGLADFARSSSGAGASDIAPDGVLTYIPFGIDAVTYATSSTSDIPSNLTKAEVASIFKGGYDRVAVTGTTKVLVAKGAADPSGTDRITPITTFIPQAGSGTRSYWLGQVGITETEISSNTYPNLKDKDLSGAEVQEHKGAALVSGTAAQNRGTIVPFSIGQWVAQANGKVTDHRAGAVVNSVDGVAPTTGSGTAYALNGGYSAYTRKVYNIVPSNLADDETSAVYKAFVGTGSLVCQQSATITAYGFGLLTGSGANACGDASVRAYAPSTSTTTLAAVGAAAVGATTTLSASVTSFGNGGGTLFFEDAAGKLLAQGTVAKGATKGTASWTPAAAGSVAVTATFVPALAGVAASASAAATVTVAAAGATTTTVKAGKATIGKATSVTATIANAKGTAGTVSFTAGSVKKSVAVKAGATTATFSFVPTAVSTKVTATFAPAGTAVKGSTGTVTVKAAKAAAKVTVKAKKAKVAKVALTVTVKAGVKAAGKVTVKEGKKTLATAKVKGSKATVTIKKLKAGKHTVVVSYKGSATVKAASSKKTKITVKK